MDGPSSQNRTEDSDSTFDLYNHVLFVCKMCSHLSQNSSSFIRELSLLLPLLRALVSQMQPSPGILMDMTQSLSKLSFGSIPWQSHRREVQQEYVNPVEILFSG